MSESTGKDGDLDVRCPRCHSSITLDETWTTDIRAGAVSCPECGSPVPLDQGAAGTRVDDRPGDGWGALKRKAKEPSATDQSSGNRSDEDGSTAVRQTG